MPIVEKKVKAATAGSLATSAAIAVINAWMDDDSLLGSLPPWAQSLVLILGPTVVTFVSGYVTSHTPKPG